MNVRDISEESFDLIVEENSDSELEGQDGWRRVACDAKSSYAWKIQVYAAPEEEDYHGWYAREINPTWMSHKSHRRRVFLEQLGKALVAPLIERRKIVPQTEASAQIVKAFQSARLPDRLDDQASTSTFKTSKRKRCQFCPKEMDNKTNNSCFKCNKYTCKGCSLSYCSSCAQ
ncbi:unnamed protein product [Lepeophtheirus salmonis]|uniref:(salmon louse) hypothetical protein n=1 Tax=Lepeophtheirus salmonis TaxID=72036 RepID=A0A7R8CR55_LEPSM|nr:unnamed protein product [Lepeophtheirus salmonis]CAF2901746.1 unnamed protein product [Lepeophtheirus salmonis]